MRCLKTVLVLSAAAMLLILAGAEAQPARAQSSTSTIQNFRDRFGNPAGVRVTIRLLDVNHFWVFNLSEQVLRMPLAAQINLLDQRFGLGADREAVLAVLQTIQENRRLDEQRRQMENIAAQKRQMENMRRLQESLTNNNRTFQPPIQIPQPPVYQPPMQVPQPQRIR